MIAMRMAGAVSSRCGVDRNQDCVLIDSLFLPSWIASEGLSWAEHNVYFDLDDHSSPRRLPARSCCCPLPVKSRSVEDFGGHTTNVPQQKVHLDTNVPKEEGPQLTSTQSGV